METKEAVFGQIKKSFEQGGNFDSFLGQKLNFDGRDWTAGQFLYKYFYDQVQGFVYQAKDHPETLSDEDKALAEKFKFLYKNGMVGPLDVFKKIEARTMPDVDMFDGNREKESFYRELFAGEKRGTPDNPCYWTPVSQFQTRYIESRLSQMGMDEGQVRALMVHCEKERERTEAFYRKNMPAQFVHNSRVSPEKMEGGCIRIKPRTEDQFLNLQKFCFVAPEGSFHSGLPMQDRNIDFVAWQRFSQEVSAFHMTMDQAMDKIVDSYNYRIDMQQKDTIHPIVPLWGGAPKEWIAKKNLTYSPEVEKETFKDLLNQGNQVFIVPNEEDWKNWMQGKEQLPPDEARRYLAGLSAQYPDRVIQLDKKFVARLNLHRQVQKIKEGINSEEVPQINKGANTGEKPPKKSSVPIPYSGR